ncbi:Coatomer, epsilon subunit like protein [Aduncisulcus paluster]|uniref:Coatomer, epsilon subunit like protein n=1 Tax=Aduncisulcus paluster TaxID=2918883 RepID=A0ABQ5JXK2_9EUKA|nr:Coatomer, epsilon subunit like protein [Aduncisulcus paluster]
MSKEAILSEIDHSASDDMNDYFKLAISKGTTDKLKMAKSMEDKADSEVKKLCIAQFYESLGMAMDTLRILHGLTSLEARIRRVRCYLRIFRRDLAEKEVKVMSDMNEEDVTTLQAAIYLHSCKNEYSAAIAILSQLRDNYGDSPHILSSIAALKISKAKSGGDLALLDEARKILERAELSGGATHAGVLANLCVCARLEGAIDTADSYQSRLTSFQTPGDLGQTTCPTDQRSSLGLE